MSVTLMVPVSIGEALDKVTILEIKDAVIRDTIKLANIRAELKALRETLQRELGDLGSDVRDLVDRLREINQTLWNVEDEIRLCESRSDFGGKFIELARDVYITNDERAAVKKKINEALGSTLIEEKSYKDYRPA